MCILNFAMNFLLAIRIVALHPNQPLFQGRSDCFEKVLFKASSDHDQTIVVFHTALQQILVISLRSKYRAHEILNMLSKVLLFLVPVRTTL